MDFMFYAQLLHTPATRKWKKKYIEVLLLFNISDIYLNNKRASLQTGNTNIFNNTKGFTMKLPPNLHNACLLIITGIRSRHIQFLSKIIKMPI